MKTKAMILFAALLLMENAVWVQAQCLTLEVRDTDRVQGFLYVAVFQDLNGNGTLDTGICGVPQEPTVFRLEGDVEIG